MAAVRQIEAEEQQLSVLDPAGRDRKGASGRGGEISVVRTIGQVDALVPEWTDLFCRSGVRNPFAHPVWMTTWARHFVAPDDIYLITVRDEGGSLVGVAPFFRSHRKIPHGPGVTQLRLLGTGYPAYLTELPQILTLADGARKVIRDVMAFIATADEEWDWAEVALTPEQGWFEPEWVPADAARAGSFVLHKNVRACVVLPLPATWDELRSSLKRNVKESVRRGTNRLAREGHHVEMVVPDNQESVIAALGELARLHGDRSRIPGKVRHANYFTNPQVQAFMRDVGLRMFSAGHLTPSLLHVDGVTVAARLLLNAHETTFFSMSGFDPAWWQHNVATTMMAECLKSAIARGDTLANLSIGPDVAKLRWSEQLELHNDFVLVNSRRRSRLAFALYWQIQAASRVRAERRRYQIEAD